jgi:hypothetical protein
MARARRRSRSVMNQKRVKLLEGIAQGMNVSEAGRYAGYGPASSAHRAYERLKLETPDKLNAMGCPVERVLKKAISELEAEETKIGWYKGGLVQAVNVVAHDIRLEAADILPDLYNAYPRSGRDRDDSGAGWRSYLQSGPH